MPSFSTFKRTAREALGGSWGGAILVLLIDFGVYCVVMALQFAVTNLLVPPPDPSAAVITSVNEFFFNVMFHWSPVEIALTVAFTVVGILLSSPLTLGVIYWYQALVLGKRAPIPEVFRSFETGGRYLRAVWFQVNLSVRGVLWWALFFTAPMTVYYFALRALIDADKAGVAAESATASMGLLLAAALLLLAGIFYGAVMNRYFLAAYLISGDDGLTVREAIKTSIAYSKGYRFRVLGFQLSFFFWFLLSPFCLFLPFLCVLPYYSASNAALARYIIDQSRRPPTDETREFLV